MSYLALYRQWRPQFFSDLVGQEHITKTLQNQISGGRIAHAYLFCGPRGTGKTTTAKIFAKAINCMSPSEGEPCGECDVCQKLSLENAMDIIEIDAASNNGVDEIRDLREKVKFPPTVGKYKVYIIDEVHMLSQGAFNALLKTLEEPPGHVVFILATTEPQRLPATILSRCQRYDFRRIALGDMVKRLKVVAEGAGAQFDEEGLRIIAHAAEGGMRDALSLMDQCISFCGEKVTARDITDLLGTVDRSFLFEVAGEILAGNTAAVLRAVDRLMDEGREIAVFTRDLIQHFRNLLLVKVCGECADILDVTGETLEEYRLQGEDASRQRMIRAIDQLTALETEMKWSTQPRVLLEVALVKICRPDRDDSHEALLERIELLEKASREGGLPQKKRIEPVSETPPIKQRKAAPVQTTKSIKEDPAPSSKEDVPGKLKNPAKLWSDVMNTIRKEKMGLYMLMVDGKLHSVKDSVMTIAFPESGGFYVAALEKEDNRKFIEDTVQRLTGREYRIKFTIGDSPTEDSTPAPAQDDGQEVVQRAIEVFGDEFVEVVEDTEEE
ncbi:MAG: DNA polymerase III subunit gamma/tau [Clostridia bacterium]